MNRVSTPALPASITVRAVSRRLLGLAEDGLGLAAQRGDGFQVRLHVVENVVEAGGDPLLLGLPAPVFRQGRDIGVHVAGDAGLFVRRSAVPASEAGVSNFSLTVADKFGQGLGLAGQVAAFEPAQRAGPPRPGSSSPGPVQLGFQRFQ